MNRDQFLKIIIIDDNPKIHSDFKKILKTTKDSVNLGRIEQELFGSQTEEKNLNLPRFHIDTASQGEEGFKLIKRAVEAGDPYALAFVDIRMPPGWDGIQTIKKILKIDTNIQIVICTAYSDYSWEETIKELGQRDNLLILKKPFDSTSVRQLACALSKKWQLIQEGKKYMDSLEHKVKERTSSLKQSVSLMRATIESSADAILVVTSDGIINDYNMKIIEMLDLPLSLIETKNFGAVMDFLLSHIIDPNQFVSNIGQISAKSNKSIIGTIHFKNGKILEYYSQNYKLDNKIIGRVWNFHDVTTRALLEQKLHYQAMHDPLTGLPNRVSLHQYIQKLIAEAKVDDHMFAVLFLDLDRFKLVNDSLSHSAGDEILCSLSSRIKTILRDEDVLSRLGGDEFVVVIDHVTDQADLCAIASKLLSVVEQPFTVQGHEITLSTSIGISVYPNDGDTIDLLLRNADTAMYKSKEQGANQYQFYTDELNRLNINRLEQEEALRRAIVKSEFVLHYQPQFDLATNELVSVEALIRWKQPNNELLLPINFIPLAEDSGLIVPIGEWVLRTACRQIKEWHDQGLQKIRVAVNVTTKQFKMCDMVQLISQVLTESKLEPQYLELELTENMIINNAEIKNSLLEIKNMGVQIVLDDFGTGNSSLHYLREIAVDRLKIDQSFVKNIDGNHGDDVIIQAIIAMANSLNLGVLAEGVETKRQMEFLQSHHCEDVQGFYFSRPLSSEACQDLLRKHQIKNPETEEKMD